MLDQTSERYEAEYYKGWLVITDLTSGKAECVQLKSSEGRNITRSQFKSSLASHGFDKACQTFLKLAATYKPTSTPCY